MDGTNWKFGQQKINVLVIAIVYHGFPFPLLFQLHFLSASKEKDKEGKHELLIIIS